MKAHINPEFKVGDGAQLIEKEALAMRSRQC